MHSHGGARGKGGIYATNEPKNWLMGLFLRGFINHMNEIQITHGVGFADGHPPSMLKHGILSALVRPIGHN